MFKARTRNNPVEVNFIILGKILILKSRGRKLRKAGGAGPAAVIHLNT